MGFRITHRRSPTSCEASLRVLVDHSIGSCQTIWRPGKTGNYVALLYGAKPAGRSLRRRCRSRFDSDMPHQGEPTLPVTTTPTRKRLQTGADSTRTSEKATRRMVCETYRCDNRRETMAAGTDRRSRRSGSYGAMAASNGDAGPLAGSIPPSCPHDAVSGAL